MYPRIKLFDLTNCAFVRSVCMTVTFVMHVTKLIIVGSIRIVYAIIISWKKVLTQIITLFVETTPK